MMVRFFFQIAIHHHQPNKILHPSTKSRTRTDHIRKPARAVNKVTLGTPTIPLLHRCSFISSRGGRDQVRFTFSLSATSLAFMQLMHIIIT